MSELTPRQRRIVERYAQSADAVAAYRAVYPAESMADADVLREARQLLEHAAAVDYLAQLQARARAQRAQSAAGAADDARVRSAQARARSLLGSYIDGVVALQGGGAQDGVAGLDPEFDLEQELRRAQAESARRRQIRIDDELAQARADRAREQELDGR